MTRSTLREIAVVTSGFTALTLLLTYPQVLVLDSAVGWFYDALFSVWRLSWVAHALLHQPAHLFDANIFYPERGTLLYSDAVLLPSFVAAPFLWIGASRIVVYNLVVLLSFVLSGVAMYGLVRHLTASRLAAWFAGVVFAFQPYRFAHYSHLELLCSWPIPLAVLALDRLFVTRRVRDGVLLGVAIAMQAYLSLYYFVFLLTALAVIAMIMVLAGSRPRAIPVVVAAAIAAVLVAPYAAAYAGAARSVGLRSATDVAAWSPRLGSYLMAPASNWIYGRRSAAEMEHLLFPGALALALAAAGMMPPIDRRRIAFLVAGLVAFDVSLGIHGLTGAWVFQHVPVYRGLRVPARMAVIVSTVVAILGGYGIARLARGGARWHQALAVLFIAGVTVESASMPVPLMRVDRKPPPMYEWLSTQPRSPIMEWPVGQASSLGVTRAPWFMYYSTWHWQPVANGYSGYYPVSFVRFVEAMRAFPSADAIDYLRRDGIVFIILHSRPDEAAYVAMRRAVLATGAFELLRDETARSGEFVTLFRLKP